jgi:spoIIIJ-associated protein
MVEKEGKNKDEAVRLALEELKARPEDVKIEFLEEGKSGFLGLGPSKPAKVRVFLVNEGSSDSSALKLVQDICDKMGLACRCSVEESSEERLVIKLDSQDSGVLIGRRGKTLESLQYLVNIIENMKKDVNRKIIIDIEGYRERRKEALEKLAHKMADRVRESRRAMMLEEMNPYERRLIHLALEKEQDIETTSVGGPNQNMKRIRIALRRHGTRGK